MLMYLPSVLLSNIIQPFSPRVTITNFRLGNLRSMDIKALGVDGAFVHVCNRNHITAKSYYYYSCNAKTSFNGNVVEQSTHIKVS